jgi:restriction endonuclease S subunit
VQPKAASNDSLPKGWRMVRFGDVVKDVNEAERNPLDAGLERYVGLEHIEPENLHLKQWGNLADDQISFTKRFRKGQVLFGKRRAYQRKVAVADFDGICSSDILTFEPNGNDLLLELLPFIVQSDGFFERALGTSSGSLSPRTRWSQLQDYEFPLPPKEEQRRIADLLWAVDESCVAYCNVLENLKTLADTKAIAAFSETNEAVALASRTSTLGEVADVRYGLTVDSGRRKLHKTLPYLRVANVHRGRLDLTEVKEIGADEQDIRECSLQADDVLVVEGHADPNEIGRAALWQNKIDLCLHQNHILRVRTSTALLPKYLLVFLNSPKGKSHFRRYAKSSSGLYTINSTVLRNLQIPLPPKDAQQNVVDVIEAIQQRTGEADRHGIQIMNLKSAMINMFFGVSDVHRI